MFKSALQLISKVRRGQGEQPVRTAVMSSRRIAKLNELETKLGYSFENPGLLEQALTHKSYSHECGNTENPDYESLEFLGDSILGFVISEFLFLTFPELSEGDLSKLKSHLVSTQQLHVLSSKLDLGKFLNLSRGEDRTGGRRKRTLLADLFESLTAAIYLDGGLEPSKNFILKQFDERFEAIARDEIAFRDHKSTLQEKLHRLGLPSPAYRVIEESGPDHRKEFLVSVSSQGVVLAQGSGKSKKAAEQEAAERGIVKLEEGSLDTSNSRSKESPVDQESCYVVDGVSNNWGDESPPPQVEDSKDQS